MRIPCRSQFFFLCSTLWIASVSLPPLFAADAPATTKRSTEKMAAQKAASEDPLITNFHSLGEIDHRTNIYRSANPIGNIADRLKGAEPTEADRQQAKAQMQHLHDLGVRTVVSFQLQEPPTATTKNAEYNAVALEKAAAQEVGIKYVAYPMANSGKGALSLQYMADEDVLKIVDAASSDIVKCSETGGVLFHCQSGKDRTGMVAGYLRIKYQHWSVDDALREMREKGHVWQKFLKPGNTFSWHEEHLRAMAKTVADSEAVKPDAESKKPAK